MLLSALALLPLLAPTDSGDPPLLAVQGAERIEAFEVARSGGTALPLLTRSERVPRPAWRREGLGVLLVAGSAPLEVRAADVHVVEHATSERVVTCDGRWLRLGPAELPLATAPRRDDLAWIARQDGGVVRGPLELAFAPAEGARALVVLPGEAPLGAAACTIDGSLGPRAVAPGPTRALVWDDAPPRARLDAGELGVDQAFRASAVPLEAREGTAVAVRARLGSLARAGDAPRLGVGPDQPTFGELQDERPADLPTRVAPGEALVLWLEPPAASAEGRSQTLLLDLELGDVAAVELERRTVDADAARAPWTDVATEAGVAFLHWEGPEEQLDILPTMGPGAAWGDVDGDGWCDLFVAQGSGPDPQRALSDRLFRNRGDGSFEDWSDHLPDPEERGAGMGALLFDADGDGDLDLFVANYGADRLYENAGDGTFRDASAGLPPCLTGWSAGVCAGDVDGDGDLDLYVTTYLDFDLAKMPPPDELERYQREDPLAMLPFAFPGARNTLLVNQGGLRFTDGTEEAGVGDPAGRGMQPVLWDHDGDGDLDLYVANDVSPNVLLQNDGTGHFRDVSFVHGLDDPRGGMGLGLGDVDGDADEDLFLTNWQLESNALYLSARADRRDAKHRRATFRDMTVAAGLGSYGVGYTSWGAELFDMDCDGDLDLFVANGYTSPDYEGTGVCVGQPNHLFENDGRGRFQERGAAAGPALRAVLPSRAVAACDYDQDGDVDLCVTANNSFLQLLRDDEPRRGRWLGVRLRDDGPNPFAIGARVEVDAGERHLVRTLRAGTSYLAGNPPELHFGLGDVEGPVTVTVHWPGAAPEAATRHTVSALDTWTTLTRPR